jgi:hypothetical protein
MSSPAMRTGILRSFYSNLPGGGYTTFSDHWYWRPLAGPIRYRDLMPGQIGTIFEKHGFIRGGKWYHFDTMRFEYRPALLVMR